MKPAERFRGLLPPQTAILLFAFLAFIPALKCYSQTPYLGGKGDGYASQFTQISAVQQAIAPAWMIVYPSPVRAGSDIVVTVFDVKAEVHATLYDMLGRRIAITENLAALGKVSLRVPTTGLAVGCYLLQVQRDGDAFTQKVEVWGE